jgi:hypothetical protein
MWSDELMSPGEQKTEMSDLPVFWQWSTTNSLESLQFAIDYSLKLIPKLVDRSLPCHSRQMKKIKERRQS